MKGILDFLLGYLILVIFWGIFNLFFYALSILFKKAFTVVPLIINTIISWGIQIFIVGYALYGLWHLIIAKEWLFLVLALVFGGFIIGWWQTIYGLLLYPFTIISAYFLQKTEDKFNADNGEFDYEELSPEGKIVEKYSSERKIQKRTAKWFVIAYGISFLNQFLTKDSDFSPGFAWYVIIPLVTVIITALAVGLIMGVFNLFKYRKFFGKGKSEFLISILKGAGILYIVSFVLNLVF